MHEDIEVRYLNGYLQYKIYSKSILTVSDLTERIYTAGIDAMVREIKRANAEKLVFLHTWAQASKKIASYTHMGDHWQSISVLSKT